MTTKNFNAKKMLMSAVTAVVFSFVFTTNANAYNPFDGQSNTSKQIEARGKCYKEVVARGKCYKEIEGRGKCNMEIEGRGKCCIDENNQKQQQQVNEQETNFFRSIINFFLRRR